MISDQYRETLRSTHAANGGWGTGSARKHLDKVVAMSPYSILDYGCGKGGLVRALRELGYDADGYDPGIDEYSTRPMTPYDLVVAFDVMEHVEEEHVAEVLADMAKLGRRARVDIALTPAVKLLTDGRNAHITVRPAKWWLEKVTTFGRTIKHIYRADDRHLDLEF